MRMPELWRVLVQGKMSPNLVVVRSIGFKDSAQLCLADHDYMIQAVAAD